MTRQIAILRSFGLAGLLCWVSACGTSEPAPDDLGVAPVPDGGTRLDGGPFLDVGGAPDADGPADAVDSGPAIDAGSTNDGGVSPDGGDGGDAGPIGQDAAPGPDAAPLPLGTYVGVPNLTDPVPSAIMPTLPAAGVTRPGWPYDPLALATPSPSGAADEYVVSTTGSDANAGNGGRGTLAAPRRSVPEGTFAAGTKIFVYGANSAYGTVDFNMGDTSAMSFDCTDAAPCWWVGIDNPRLGRRIDLTNSHHLIMDGLSFVDIPGGGRPFGQIQISNSTYIAQRSLEVRGSGANSPGGQLQSMTDVEFLVTFRCSIHDGGSWESNATDLDVHGWRPGYGNRYLWLLESTIYHMQADSIQTGNSNNPNPQSDVSHYIYIAGNEFYENYENALDNKNSYHVVFSGNVVHDFYPASGASGANGTAIILSNNSEGPWTGYHWALNNRIWNTALAIRDSGSEADEKNFAVGNVIWNANTAFTQQNNAANREAWFINNSVTGASSSMSVGQPGSNSSLFVRNNVFHQAGTLNTQGAVNSVLSGNVIFGSTVNGAWDVNADNATGDPLLQNPAQGDLTPLAGSVATGVSAEDPVYALFTALYGLDIRRDLNGAERPTGGWDIGAVEVP